MKITIEFDDGTKKVFDSDYSAFSFLQGRFDAEDCFDRIEDYHEYDIDFDALTDAHKEFLARKCTDLRMGYIDNEDLANYEQYIWEGAIDELMKRYPEIVKE